jgi:hypothetical protein
MAVDTAIAVVDDIAIGTDNVEEHLVKVTEIISKLAEKGFSVKVEKMHLFVEEFIFLGHLSTETGLQATDHLVKAVREMPVPRADQEDAKKQLRSFLGMASYARKFIKDFAKKSQPLNRLLEKGVLFEWNDECQSAWDEIVSALCDKIGLWALDYSQPLYIRTDACARGLGAYLFQIVEVEKEVKGNIRIVKEERVIGFWNRSVPVPMRNYDARRLEFLAVIMALEHFKPFIEVVRVELDTDHRNLTWIQNVKHSSGQLARWAMRLSEFNFQLKYRAGIDNQVADALSRNPIPQELSQEEAASVMFAFYFERVEAEVQTWEQRKSEDSGATYCVTWGKITDPDPRQEEAFAFARTQVEPVTEDSSGEESDCADAGEFDMDKLLAQASATVTLEEIKNEQASDAYVKQVIDSLAGQRKATQRNKWKLQEGVLYACAEGVEEKDALRIYVPETLRVRLMSIFHSGDFMMHAGRDATTTALKRRYY